MLFSLQHRSIYKYQPRLCIQSWRTSSRSQRRKKKLRGQPLPRVGNHVYTRSKIRDKRRQRPQTNKKKLKSRSLRNNSSKSAREESTKMLQILLNRRMQIKSSPTYLTTRFPLINPKRKPRRSSSRSLGIYLIIRTAKYSRTNKS